ncbi:unknown [Clostridium sp. CAG:448]|nr:unknown [Clostridium sp. CAG:448]
MALHFPFFVHGKLHHAQLIRINEACVAGDDVPLPQQKQISGHDVSGFRRQKEPVTDDFAERVGIKLHGFTDALCLQVRKSGNKAVYEQNQKNRNIGTDIVTEEKRYAGNGEQQPQKRIPEHLQDAFPCRHTWGDKERMC